MVFLTLPAKNDVSASNHYRFDHSVTPPSKDSEVFGPEPLGNPLERPPTV
jgi:hypothetical protein